MPYSDRNKWNANKQAGRRLFAPELGGTYQVFNERPLSDAIIAYLCE